MREPLVKLINQVFEIEKKIAAKPELSALQRHVTRMKEHFEELGLNYHSPLGEPFNETRTDCEASIAGESSENLVITEVIKPIVRQRDGNLFLIIQKGVVIAESK
ncbi:MAG TPA: hypothetical protein VI112_05565 [Bacteroidia bacterium]|jgi:hypothetical protein